LREVGIYDLMKAVRSDIMRIQEDAEIQSNPLFNLKSLEIKLNVVVSKVTEAGVKFWIVTAGGEYKQEQVSTITLNLEPLVKVKQRKVGGVGGGVHTKRMVFR